MKYLLMIHMNPAAFDALTEEQRNEIMNAHEPFQRALKESGEFVGTHALGDPSTSAVVRVEEGGATVVTDGPFAESKEHLAGFYVVECDSRERALEIAATMPEARLLGVEVRPVVFSTGADV
ncbi:YciI family protein [Actinomadura miaoliensis]|uniref:YciI family protein n=1 Tax=Actinomadura miaoliensis TaxID=430685 RepID=A0ABP7VMG4_9ACTN